MKGLLLIESGSWPLSVELFDDADNREDYVVKCYGVVRVHPGACFSIGFHLFEPARRHTTVSEQDCSKQRREQPGTGAKRVEKHGFVPQPPPKPAPTMADPQIIPESIISKISHVDL